MDRGRERLQLAGQGRTPAELREDNLEKKRAALVAGRACFPIFCLFLRTEPEGYFLD